MDASRNIKRCKSRERCQNGAQREAKIEKYDALKEVYHVVPVGSETFGSWGSHAKKFLEELGNLLIKKTKEKRSKHWMYQRLSMAIVRGNVASVMGTTGYSEKFELFYFNQ